MQNTGNSALLRTLAASIADLSASGVRLVAIDGVDGAGKTTLADKLAEFVIALGRPVVRASVDGFHNPRSMRYRLGRSSPEGFYSDSYNYELLRACLLTPLSRGRSRIYRRAAFDHTVDQPVHINEETAPPNAVLILDGIFLHRPELIGYWDFSVFLDVPFDISIPRGASRGADFGSSDPHAPSNKRYIKGQKLYLRECRPQDRATVLIDNADYQNPLIVAQRPSLMKD